MAGEKSIVDQTCRKCGICLEVCPDRIFVQDQKGAIVLDAGKTHLCNKCGHCMAVCPTQSIKIAGLAYDQDFFALPAPQTEAEAFYNVLATRRSTRVFQNKPVPNDLLEKITEAVAMAPMGFPPHKTEITVVQNRAVLDEALKYTAKSYQEMLQGMENPLIRSIIRLSVNREIFNTMKNQVMPIMKMSLPRMEKSGEDVILRGAPAMLVFHADKAAENHTHDALIGLTYGLLAAHALGLGATAIGLVPPVIQRSKILRNLFQIPEENEVLAAMVVGYPKYQFQRGIRRALRKVTWI
ncbi:MAG TPA: nitroreductase family protein [Methylomusa anaerophila]|uniref:Nitroreductase family protein n=1 Tax=Methylomusa anaerophila TaxID=1930071 RepID=A0A348AHI4_9FIRM|nr:nitroreductase family protein [Methylomusa anaerophila]BBB90532.1 nitroreductase family protein [Methylomusa anaerophila]HML89828.1 nitroreductase family protein [Methylomusa anaerophila]